MITNEEAQETLNWAVEVLNRVNDINGMIAKLLKEDFWLSLSEDQRRGVALSLHEWLREGK